MGSSVTKQTKSFISYGWSCPGHNHKHTVPSKCWIGNSILMKSESKVQFNSWYVFEHLWQHNT